MKKLKLYIFIFSLFILIPVKVSAADSCNILGSDGKYINYYGNTYKCTDNGEFNIVFSASEYTKDYYIKNNLDDVTPNVACDVDSGCECADTCEDPCDIHSECYCSDTSSASGMPNCLNSAYPIGNSFSAEFGSADSEGYRTINIYTAGRMDAWGNLNPGRLGGTKLPKDKESIKELIMTWSALKEMGGNQIFPGMSISYRRYTPLTHFVEERLVQQVIKAYENGTYTIKDADIESGDLTGLSKYITDEIINDLIKSYTEGNLYIKVASISRLPGDATGEFESVSVSQENFRVEDAAIESIDGNYYISYTVTIENLRIGYDSVNKGELFGISGLIPENVNNTIRSYHYYLPIVIDVKYKSSADKCLDPTYAAANPDECDSSTSTKNPCIYGTDTQTAEEYAYANLGTCCYEFPATCCNTRTLYGGIPWIGTASDDGIWISYYVTPSGGKNAALCCTDPIFRTNNPGKCPSSGFTKTSDKKCSTDGSDTIYTTSYIELDSSGNLYDNNGKDTGIDCDKTTGKCSSEYTYSYTISVDNPYEISYKSLGYSYFDNGYKTDYDNYLKQNSIYDKVTEVGGTTLTTKYLPPDNYKAYSLAGNNFKYEVTNLRKDGKRYLIDVKVTINNLSQYFTDMPKAYLVSGSNIYFVPIKISLCYDKSSGSMSGGSKCSNPTYAAAHPEICGSGESTCSDMTYAAGHLNECCGKKAFGEDNYLICCNSSNDFYDNNKDICDKGTNEDPKNKGFKVNSSLTCNSATKTSDEEYNTKKEMPNNNSVNINKEKIFIKASSVGVEAGTGFEYSLEITGNLEYSLNMINGYDKDHPLDEKNDILSMHTSFKNTLDAIKKNNFVTEYIDLQEIKFYDDRTERYIPIIIDSNSIAVSNPEYSGSVEYFYKDDEIICSTYEYWYSGDIFTGYRWEKNGSEYHGNVENDCNSSVSGRSAVLKGTISNTNAKQVYTYKTKLPYAYINKNGIKGSNDIKYVETENNPNEKKYILGGNKIYTTVVDPTGTYNFNISIRNGGISQKINNNNLYSCHYTVLNCVIDGTCQCDPLTDPSCPNPDCDPLTDPNCPTPPSPGTPNHYFRPISLTNPFPNDEREIGPNWFSYKNGNSYKYITTDEDDNEKGENVYTQEPMYEITITNQMARDIRDYNRLHSDYSSYDTMTLVDGEGSALCSGLCRESDFLTNLINNGQLIVRNDLINNRFRRNNGAIETMYGGDN